jgi:MerR family transcriptional regulator, heat shock protein HspR
VPRDPRFVVGPAGAYELADDTPIYVISVAAQLAGMHPQTLRQYDRLGLVTPGRTGGGGRRYSLRDIAELREVQRLSQEEGVNLAGIKRIIELQRDVDELRAHAVRAEAQLELLRRELRRRTHVVGPRRALPAGGRTTGRPLDLWRPESWRADRS